MAVHGVEGLGVGPGEDFGELVPCCDVRCESGWETSRCGNLPCEPLDPRRAIAAQTLLQRSPVVLNTGEGRAHFTDLLLVVRPNRV